MLKKALFILFMLFLFLMNQRATIEEDSVFSDPTEITSLSHDKEIQIQDQLNNYEFNRNPNAALCINNRIQLNSERSERPFKITTKLFELILQKEQNIRSKISETLLITQSIKFSSLRIRSGHWVYVLRKIII